MTSTDIATTNGADGNAPATLAMPATDTTRSLMEWAADLSAAHQIGKALASTQIVPDGLRGKPDECAAVILAGATVGLAPTTSLQSMHVVNGRVGMSTNLMVAIVRRDGHDIWTEEQTAERATVVGRRKSWPQDRVERVTITIEQAKDAGWAKPGRDGKKSPWDNPSDMLYYRAASRVCKKIAPEALHGIPSADEAEDLPPIQVDATVGAPVHTVTAADILGASEPVENPATPATATDPAPTNADTTAVAGPADIPISEGQRKELSELLRATGRSRAPRKYLTEKLGRNIETPTDLTSSEAADVIAALTDEVAAQQPELEQAD